jgi:hypothetical protein
LKYAADTVNTVVDAKGDLLVGTAADTLDRLAVGTNDHVLTADSAQPSGVKWAAIPTPGLVFVKSQTIGTGVSSVAVADAFSSSYDTYVVTISGGVASASTYLSLQLGSTTSGYYFGQNGTRWDTGASTSVFGSNQASFTNACYGNSDTLYGYFILLNPFLAKRTFLNAFVQLNVTTGVGPLFGGGYLNDNTSYTGFTLATVTALATVTGGTIRVYGMRNS